MSKRTQEEMNNDIARVEDKVEEMATKDVGDKASRHKRLERLKREKRLAMNRVHARNRRANKKMRLETLEMQVQELTKKNAAMEKEKKALLTRVSLLQVELKKRKAELALSMSNSSAGRGGATAGGFQLPPSRAALSGLMSPPLAVASSSSTSEGSRLLGARELSTPSTGAMEHAEKRRYMDLLQRTARKNGPASLSSSSTTATMEYENRVNTLLASALAQRHLAGSKLPPSGRLY